MEGGSGRLDKLLARLDSPYRAEALASAGKVYDYLKATGGSWRELLQGGVVYTAPPPDAPAPSAPSLVRVPRSLPGRVRRARRVLHFLAPPERRRLATIELELDEFATLLEDNMTFLEEIFLRTGV